MTVSKSVVRTKPGVDLSTILTADGVQVIEVVGQSAAGYSLHGEYSFYIGRYTLNGQLKAPPSAPGLPVANLPVKIVMLGTPLAMTAKSDASGKFTATNIPAGNAEIISHTVRSGKTLRQTRYRIRGRYLKTPFSQRQLQGLQYGTLLPAVVHLAAVGFQRVRLRHGDDIVTAIDEVHFAGHAAGQVRQADKARRRPALPTSRRARAANISAGTRTCSARR